MALNTYWIIMTTKHKLRTILSLLVLFFLFCAPQQSAFAQGSISSPYSRYGLGNISKTGSAYNASMGGIQSGLRNQNYINPGNPASYTAFDTNTFNCEIALGSTFNQLQSSISTQEFTNHTTLAYIYFGFPVARWMSTAIGVEPFSRAGYKITSYDTLANIGNIEEQFDGKGGVNKAFIGLAFRPFKNLSFGANVSYLFGTIYQNRAVYFKDQSYIFDVRVREHTSVSSLYFNYGLQYQIFFPKNQSLVIGSNFDLPYNINAKKTLIAERFTTSGDVESIKDTIENIDNQKGSIRLPLTIGGGLTFSRDNKWSAGADFHWQQWSKFKSFGETDSVSNSFGISAGGEFTPNANAIKKYFSRVSYRLGFHYNRSYLELRDTKIDDWGISIGFAFPVRKLHTIINLGIDAGKKGKVSKNLLQENYINVTLAFTFREFWFYRPKLD